MGTVLASPVSYAELALRADSEIDPSSVKAGFFGRERINRLNRIAASQYSRANRVARPSIRASRGTSNATGKGDFVLNEMFDSCRS
jgi:hypothetical protein